MTLDATPWGGRPPRGLDLDQPPPFRSKAFSLSTVPTGAHRASTRRWELRWESRSRSGSGGSGPRELVGRGGKSGPSVGQSALAGGSGGRGVHSVGGRGGKRVHSSASALASRWERGGQGGNAVGSVVCHVIQRWERWERPVGAVVCHVIETVGTVGTPGGNAVGARWERGGLQRHSRWELAPFLGKVGGRGVLTYSLGTVPLMGCKRPDVTQASGPTLVTCPGGLRRGSGIAAFLEIFELTRPRR